MTIARATTLVAAALLAGWLSSSSPARAQADQPSPGYLAPAPETYLRDCAFCHGNAGEGTPRGPDLRRVGAASADFYLTTGRMPIDEGEKVERGPTQYSDAEIDELVRYLASLGGGPAIPEVDLSTADVPLGAELYTEHCAACHGSAGAGGALTSGFVAPSLEGITPVQIAEAIRVGPGTMPLFSYDTLDDEQLDAIVAYTDYLQEPDDAGGRNLGHIGPVTEGLVGWAIGLGALLALTRWIGTTADE